MRNNYAKAGKKRAAAGFLFILPSLAGVALFVLLPFVDVLLQSFQSPVSREWVGLDNFRTLFQSSAFKLAATNTLRFTAVCIPVLLFLSLLTGVMLHGQKTYGNTLKAAYLVPMAIPVASVVLLWRVLFDKNGLLNALLSQAGHMTADWMNTGYAFHILVFSYIWKNLGYDIVLWMAGLSGISESIYEAAKVDGAGAWNCFTKITLPNLKPALYTITVLSLLNSFKVFREGYLVAGDYPHESMYLLQHLFSNWFREMDFHKLSAAAVLIVLAVILLVCLLQKAWDAKE